MDKVSRLDTLGYIAMYLSTADYWIEHVADVIDEHREKAKGDELITSVIEAYEQLTAETHELNDRVCTLMKLLQKEEA